MCLYVISLTQYIHVHVFTRDERRKEERRKQGQQTNKAKQHVRVHVFMRDERRKEGRSKQGQTNNKAEQHSTPKAVTFPKKDELPHTCTCSIQYAACRVFDHVVSPSIISFYPKADKKDARSCSPSIASSSSSTPPTFPPPSGSHAVPAMRAGSNGPTHPLKPGRPASSMAAEMRYVLRQCTCMCIIIM